MFCRRGRRPLCANEDAATPLVVAPVATGTEDALIADAHVATDVEIQPRVQAPTLFKLSDLLDLETCPAERQRPAESKSLEFSPHSKSWNKCISLWNTEAVILIWGPTGCGKSVGARTIAKLKKTIPFEITIDAARASEDLRRMLVEVSKTKTLFGKRTLIVEDIEGFDDSFLNILFKFCKQFTECDTRVLLTCENRYTPRLSKFRTFADVRLVEPTREQMLHFAHNTYRGMPKHLLSTYVDQVRGDLRQLHQRIKNTGALKIETTIAQPNLFQTTSCFLSGAVAKSYWMSTASTALLTRLMFGNYLKFAEGTRVHEFADVIAIADVTNDSSVLAEVFHGISSSGSVMLEMPSNVTSRPSSVRFDEFAALHTAEKRPAQTR